MKILCLILMLFVISLYYGKPRVSNKNPNRSVLNRSNHIYLKSYRKYFSANGYQEKDKNARDNIDKNFGKDENEKQGPQITDTLSVLVSKLKHRSYHASNYHKYGTTRIVAAKTIDDNLKFHAYQAKYTSSEHAVPPTLKYSQENVSRNRREVRACLKEGSCINNINRDIPVCYCDSNCGIYNDCCHDSQVTVGLMEKEKATSAVNMNYTSCILNIISDLMGRIHRGYIFVSLCPQNGTTNETRHKCDKKEIKEDDVPVTGYDGLVYKNEHCAICHGVTNFLRWNLEYDFTCEVTLYDLLNVNYSKDIMEVFKRKACEFNVLPPKTLPRPRVCWNITLATSEDATNMSYCLRYQNPVFYRTEADSQLPLARNPLCIHQSNIWSCVLPVNELNRSPHSMLAIFNFNVPRKSDGKQCVENEEETCGFDAVIGNSEVEITLKMLTNATYVNDVIFRAMGLANVLIKRFMPWQKNLKRKLYNSFDALCYYNQVYDTNRTFPCTNSSNCYIINIVYYFSIEQTIPLQELSLFYQDLNRMNWIYIEKDKTELERFSITTFKYDQAMENSTPDKTFKNCFSHITNIAKSQQYDNKLGEELREVNPEVKRIPNFLEVIASSVQNGSSVQDKINSFKVLSISYSIGETVWKRFFKETDIENVYLRNIQFFLSFVSNGISTIFLLATLIIHKYFKLFNNVTGKVCEKLMVTMSFSHLFLMLCFGFKDNHMVCLIIGILSHYFWLCCFTWMTTNTITLLKTMLKQNQDPNSQLSSQFPVYNYVIGYCTPLMIVIPSAILDLTDSFHIGYTSDICFLSVFPLNVVIFLCPIFLSILFNVSLLLYAGCKIFTFEQNIEIHPVTIGVYSYRLVFLRFCIFSGLSWMIGIITEATDHNILRILFMFLTGSHGILLSIFFLICREVKYKIITLKDSSTVPAVFTVESLF